MFLDEKKSQLRTHSKSQSPLSLDVCLLRCLANERTQLKQLRFLKYIKKAFYLFIKLLFSKGKIHAAPRLTYVKDSA